MSADRRIYLALVVLLLVGSAAGCSSTEPRPPYQVGDELVIQPDEQLNTTSPLNLTGEVHFSLHSTTPEKTKFEDVRLCLYGQNGTVIESVSLGTFEGPSTTRDISVQTEQMPWYIYVHHPDFPPRLTNTLRVYYPELDRFSSGTPSELPFDADRLTDTRCTPA